MKLKDTPWQKAEMLTDLAENVRLSHSTTGAMEAKHKRSPKHLVSLTVDLVPVENLVVLPVDHPAEGLVVDHLAEGLVADPVDHLVEGLAEVPVH